MNWRQTFEVTLFIGALLGVSIGLLVMHLDCVAKHKRYVERHPDYGSMITGTLDIKNGGYNKK